MTIEKARDTALRGGFKAKLGEKRREALRAQNLIGVGREHNKEALKEKYKLRKMKADNERHISQGEYNTFHTPYTKKLKTRGIPDYHVLNKAELKAVMCARN